MRPDTTPTCQSNEQSINMHICNDLRGWSYKYSADRGTRQLRKITQRASSVHTSQNGQQHQTSIQHHMVYIITTEHHSSIRSTPC